MITTMATATTPIRKQEATASVYCPICTHTVQAQVLYNAKSAKVTPGQKCGRCASALDAGVVIHFNRAA